MPVHVTSEIGLLRSVLVHTPGPELLAVTPATRDDYLYDDIIDVEAAQREHRRFVAILERFAKVHFVRDLLAEAAANADARELLMRETAEIVGSSPLAAKIAQRPPEELVQMLIEGEAEDPGPLAKTLNEVGYLLPPLPNLFFTRDTAMVVGDHVMIGSMRHSARWSEELLMKALFRYHPALANKGILYDGAAERRHNYTLEGGDVHPLRSDAVLLGFSERTSPAAIDTITEALFAQTAVTEVIIVVMPTESTAIHLDMVFTQLDTELCSIFPPAFVGAERLSILHRRKGMSQIEGDAEHLRGAADGGPANGAGVLRGRTAHRPGARAVGERMQLLRGAPRRRALVFAQRDDDRRALEDRASGTSPPRIS